MLDKSSLVCRDPQTPERDRHSEREQQRLQRLQMTSPTTRCQRQYDRQAPIPQPIFAPPITGPSAPRIDWNQWLQQGYQLRQTKRRHNYHGQYETMAPVAGPSHTIHGRVNWSERLQQGYQTRLTDRQRNNGRDNAQRQIAYEQEALAHQTHLAELQRQREMDALQHQAHLAELQQQREIEALQHQAHLAELQQQTEIEAVQHQAHLDEVDLQQQLLDAMEDQELLAQAQQIQQQEQEAELDHIQDAIHAIHVLGTIPIGFRPYHDPDHRLSLGSMNMECPHCHTLHFMSEKLTASSRTSPKFGICCLQGQIQLPPFSESPQLLHSLLTSSTPRARKFRDNIR